MVASAFPRKEEQLLKALSGGITISFLSLITENALNVSYQYLYCQNYPPDFYPQFSDLYIHTHINITFPN